MLARLRGRDWTVLDTGCYVYAGRRSVGSEHSRSTAPAVVPMRKLCLANLPTPLFHHPGLDALVGAEVWVKRDDMTAGAETGNKLRKLEYLLGQALTAGASCVVTCGSAQSNHCRATALAARQLGLGSVLLLRGAPADGEAARGNLLLDQLAGAQLHYVSPEQYANRDALMAELAQKLRAAGEVPYIVPEGGSNGLGALGYVDAMAELAEQLRQRQAGAIGAFDTIALACGSGGTAAGVALGAAAFGIAKDVLALAVCDDAAYFERRIAAIMAEARALRPSLSSQGLAPVRVVDQFRDSSPEQLAFIVEVARTCGLVLDPTYTAKALHGLALMERKPSRLCFIHTGGCPGLLAAADSLLPYL